VAGRVDELVALAADRTALDDLGPDSWVEGLQVLVDTLETAPEITAEGRNDLYRQFVDGLANRLRVVDYVATHPEVDDERIERPLVVLGLPRTGTTAASYLLDQDPARRSLLNWEAGDSVPPAGRDTLRTDPRCLAKKAELDAFAAELQAARFPIPHWEEADGPTECTFVHNQDFKAFLWEAFMPNSAYSDWLLDTDMTSAYDYERTVLKVLQSAAPGTWSLKMPSHAVHIEALVAAFPDVRIVWAHRDPYKVTGSFLSMQELSRAVASGGQVDMGTIVPVVLQQLHEHVQRTSVVRDRIGADRFFDLHYAELMRDPLAQMRSLYAWAGDELSPAVERSMLEWVEHNPQDRFGTRQYALDSYGLTVPDLEPLFADYVSTFEIELEGA
jgi:Sulfotransferase family